MLTIDQNPTDKRVFFRFDGKLDTNACQPLSEEIDRHLAGLQTEPTPGAAIDSEIIFDLQKVSFIASAFIRICISCAKKIAKGKFSIVNCDPLTKKTFKITGLDELLRVE